MEYRTNTKHVTELIIEIRKHKSKMDYTVNVVFPFLKQDFQVEAHTYDEALKIADKYCLELTGEEFKDDLG